MREPASVGAAPQIGLVSCTGHVIQDNGPRALSKLGISWGRHGPATAQLPAHHIGIVDVPAVVTHGAPGTLVKDLHATLTPVSSIHEPQSQTRVCSWKDMVGSPLWSCVDDAACTLGGQLTHELQSIYGM